MNAYDFCRHLVETWPNRWIGSRGESEAGDWAETFFRELGLHTRRLWFDAPAWDYEGTELLVDGERIEAGAQMFSPACDAEAELVRIRCDGKGGFAGDVTSRIALIREDETGGVLSRGRLARALVAAGALGAVVLSRLPETWSTKIFRDPEAGLSAVGVSARTGETLLAKNEATARLRIDANPHPGKTSDVVAQTRPSSPPPSWEGQGEGPLSFLPPDEPVVIVCAHTDAAPYSPGAFDNAAGCGMVMELAERFAGTPDAPGLRFCLFGGHEFGGDDACGFGSKSYVRDYADELSSVKKVLNFDGCGAPDSHPHLDVFGGKALLEKVNGFASPMDDLTVGHIPDDPSGADVGAFRRAGIECLWLRSVARQPSASTTYHSPLDDLRCVDAASLARCVDVAHRLLSSDVFA